MEAYGNRLFQFYEAHMWADTTNISSRLKKERVRYMGAHTENLAQQIFRDPDRYKLESADDKEVVFTMPDSTSAEETPVRGAHYLEMTQWRISLPKSLLD